MHVDEHNESQKTLKPQRSPRRPQQQPAGPGQPPSKCPRDPAMRHWLNSFSHFHTDSVSYIPVALRMDADALDAHSSVADGSDSRIASPQTSGRYVYEIAQRNDARGEKWVLIMWEVDVPGIQFCDCADRAEAMALFSHPAQAAGRWQGVRLRPENRPW